MSKFYTRYDHLRPVSPNGGISMTDQQYCSDCDINTILRRYAVEGRVPAPSPSAISGDFSNIGDFQSCLDKVNSAKAEFAALPSLLRSRFGNDPRAYVEFVLNPANADECCKLGLRVKQKSEDTPVSVLQRIEKAVTPKGDVASTPATARASTTT